MSCRLASRSSSVGFGGMPTSRLPALALRRCDIGPHDLGSTASGGTPAQVAVPFGKRNRGVPRGEAGEATRSTNMTQRGTERACTSTMVGMGKMYRWLGMCVGRWGSREVCSAQEGSQRNADLAMKMNDALAQIRGKNSTRDIPMRQMLASRTIQRNCLTSHGGLLADSASGVKIHGKSIFDSCNAKGRTTRSCPTPTTSSPSDSGIDRLVLRRVVAVAPLQACWRDADIWEGHSMCGASSTTRRHRGSSTGTQALCV